MMTQAKNLLFGFWIGACITFAVTAFYLVSNEQNINAPGEMSEALGGVGIPLLVCFVLMTVVVQMISRREKTGS